MSNKEPFHNYDPYDHLVTVNLRLDELITQHNKLANYCDQLEGRLRKAETDSRVILHKLRHWEALAQEQARSK